MEYLCHRFGIQRRGKGHRFKDLESIYRRHLLPFLIELDADLPAQHLAGDRDHVATELLGIRGSARC